MSESLTISVDSSATVQEAAGRFVETIGAWAGRVMADHPGGMAPAGHDGGTFMLPWATYIRATGDNEPLAFMRAYRDATKRHFEQTDEWLDGYWRRQEAHHGTEHFDLFVRTLWQLEPDDAETVAQLEDAAEHIGNFKPGFPAWFDWDTGLFVSMFLGTEHVGERGANVPDHMRFVSLCLLSHDMTANGRYLDLARAHADRWVAAILAGEPLPVAINEQGPLFELGKDASAYREFAGAAPKDLAANLPRAENLIASGFPDTLLALWNKTDEPRYRQAAERIIDVAVEVLDNPIAWQAQAAVRRYRQATGSTRYDRHVGRLGGEAFRAVQQVTLVPEPVEPCIACPLGMRGDKPDWLDGQGDPCPSPLLWALKATVTGDADLMTRALDLAMAYVHLAERAYGDVTSHGCGSRSLVAICRGHGRLNGAGVVSEVLAPALVF